MDFWNPSHGIAVSDPIDGYFFIIQTEDGGKSWSPIGNIIIPRALPGEANFAGSGTCLTTEGTGNVWFGTGGAAARIFHSSDRGKTWSVCNTPIINGESSTGIFSVAFKDNLNGIIVGGDYKKIHTTDRNAAITEDGGKTWIPVKEFSPAGFCECVRYFGSREKNLIITVSPSGWSISNNNGQSWLYHGTDGFHSIDFTHDGKVGWVVGDDGKIARLVFPVNRY